MADYTEIFVEPDARAGQKTGDWVVRVGRGKGGKFVSRHRLKTAAMKRGRREGRKRSDRGAVLFERKTFGRGRGKIVARYGPAREESRGSFFGFNI